MAAFFTPALGLPEQLHSEAPAAASIFAPTPAPAGGSLQEQVLGSFEAFCSKLSQFNPDLSDSNLPFKPQPDYIQPLSSLELFNLFQVVLRHGGFDRILFADWTSICLELGIGNFQSWPLRDAYVKYLLPFEKYITNIADQHVAVVAVDAVDERSLEALFDATINKDCLTDETLPASPSPSNIVVNPGPAIREDSQTSPAPSFRDKILSKRGQLEGLVEKYFPGHSTADFFSFYQTEQEAMASTRSSLREGLRQAPKANQPFIPDTAPVRQTRSVAQTSSTPIQSTSSGHTPSSHPVGVDSSNIHSANFDVDNFEGKDTKQIAMSMRDVITPGNRPEFYKTPKEPKQPDFYHPHYPLESLDLPKVDNVYRRVLMSVRSGLGPDLEWAMFHLVQLSSQKAEKFEFEGHPLLAESLMERAIQITELCTGVAWEIERDQYQWPLKRDRPNVLNTLWGTHDILDRINSIPVTLPEDRLETAEFSDRLRIIKESTLVMRNMCLVPKNAWFVANFARGLLRDFLAVMLNLPQPPRFNELKNDALDIAESVTKYLPSSPDDPLCISLYKCLGSSDRAHITGALSALTHYSSEVRENAVNRAMECDIDSDTLTRLISFLLLKSDEDVLSGTLDFFYQYTLHRKNVEKLAKKVNMATMFIPRMVDLLSYQAQEVVEETVVQEEKLAPPPSTIPKVPAELFRKLMALPEPERSSQWLRCCFVEDSDCEITQIALWQAYQTRFGATQQGGNPQQPNTGALAAADFIKNVSSTFTTAQAQVVPATVSGQTTNKFIIRGIRPLETALTFDQWPYLYCKWSVGDKPGHFCDRAFSEPRELRLHVFVDHMDLEALDEPDQYSLDKAKKSPKACLWDHCTKYKAPSSETEMVVEHVGAHLPQDRDPKAKPQHKRKVLQSRIARYRTLYDTPIDAQGEPVGVAYKAALVMRNLAWNLPDTGSDEHTRGVPWNKYAFITHRIAIVTKFESHRYLRGILTDVINLIHGFI